MPESVRDEKVVRIRTNAIGPATASTRPEGPWQLFGETRQAAGMSRRQLARRARVDELTVDAIESGAVERLPIGDAGFRELQAVCRVLKLDPGPFVQALKERHATPLSRGLERQRPKSRRLSWLKIAVAVWIVIVAGVLIARFAISGNDEPDGEVSPSTAVSDDSASSTTPKTTTTTVPPSTAPPPPPVAYTVSIVTARADSWVEVKVDGVDVFADTIPKGETREYAGNNIQLTIGRPDAVDLVVNDATQEPQRHVELG